MIKETRKSQKELQQQQQQQATKLHSFCRKKSIDSTLPQIVRKPSIRQYQSARDLAKQQQIFALEEVQKQQEKQEQKQNEQHERRNSHPPQKLVSEFRIPNRFSSMASNFVQMFYASPPPPSSAKQSSTQLHSRKAPVDELTSIEETRIFHHKMLCKPPPKKGILKKKTTGTNSTSFTSPSQPPQPSLRPEVISNQQQHHNMVDISTIRESLQTAAGKGKTPGARKTKLNWNIGGTKHYETFSKQEYDRGGVEYVAKRLNPLMATMIKIELNELKSEMPVHEESRKNTQFYKVK